MSKQSYAETITQHGDAVRKALASNEETRAHAETLSRLFSTREQRDELLKQVDRLETEIAYLSATLEQKEVEITYLKTTREQKEASHPIRCGTDWACSVCGNWVSLKYNKPRYPRCPYCGMRFSERWVQERKKIERQEHERQANRS